MTTVMRAAKLGGEEGGVVVGLVKDAIAVVLVVFYVIFGRGEQRRRRERGRCRCGAERGP